MNFQGHATAESFAHAARTYCGYIGQVRAVDYAALSGFLLDVGRAELALEWVVEDYDDRPFRATGTGIDHELGLEKRLRELLAADIALHEAQSHIANADKERVGVLSIDLAELYGELSGGLDYWDRNEQDARMHAAWIWKHQAEHWLDHLCRSLWSVQQLRFKFGWK